MFGSSRLPSTILLNSSFSSYRRYTYFRGFLSVCPFVALLKEKEEEEEEEEEVEEEKKEEEKDDEE